MIPLASFALAGCLAVGAGSDRITAGDLAPVFPGLQPVPAETPMALAPAPGVKRVFRAPELRQLAARLNTAVPAGIGEVCFERPLAPLDPARLRDAMRRQLPDAAIEIQDYSRLPAPGGELEFPVSGLRPMPCAVGASRDECRGFWSGAVRYAGNRRFIVWAKVKVLVSAPRVIAKVDLKPARRVQASDLRLEMRREFPAAGLVASIEEAAGRVLRRPVSAGTPLVSEWLDAFKDVARGDTVKVEVWSGGAHLELEAEAEASGSAGETIPVRNPSSKNRFFARVEGKGRVSVGKGN
jgi:flagella basal body P-ring formation protein FlgA